ncbi:hypothetical protein [Sphingomonas sp.]|uniref:hypothetical protein n=1 Tax=Sphingomonas sp. TaxID=28214 RepID=UPI003B3B62CE
MRVIVLSLLAVVTSPPDQPDTVPPPRHFLKGAEERGCAAGDNRGEVVVCGREDVQERYRLRIEADDRFVEKPVRAEADILGGKASIHGEQAGIGGFVSNRAMLTIAWPF